LTPPPAPTPARPSNPAIASAPPNLRPPDSAPNVAAPQLRISRIENITRFISDYDGGECFFITPMSVGDTAARIEGFGASVTPFQVLDDSFKKANGFEADIGIRQVTVPQCPAITFLGRLRAQRANAPQLEISDPNLRSGQALTGTIDGYGNRHVELLLISDDGSVHNLSRLVKTTTDGKSFNLRLQLANSSGAQPQMVIAIASTQPLNSLQLAQPGVAAQVFPAALAEAARANQALAASARYFKLE
jgi:serine/threonine-protein kinase